MKYLYLPTTTLNFNNILSTGSVSPATVYTARKFGYNKLETVPANPFKNVLLLYRRYPFFSIMDADRDNFPLVIRIRADRLIDMDHDIRDICAYDKTIYLDPATTEFFFATPEAKKITLIKAEPSLTTKLVGLYQSQLQVVDFEQVDSFNWSRDMLDKICDGPSEAALRSCESDMRINRLKGFVCGYIFGAYKSLDGKVARFRSVIKEQRNEISAMLNDPSRGNQEKFRHALESCTILDELWSKEGFGRRRFEPEKGDRIVNDRGQIAALEYRHESDMQSSLLLIKLFNTNCLPSDFSGQLDESRFNVAMDGAKAIKNLMGNEWEGSSTQAYINDLLNNIKSGSPFDFNSSNSLTLKSFAAFVLKGDDLDKLETFLVDQGIGDFRFAFALWGAMFGFSKIPKTIYNLPEFTYRKKMHNYVHSIVHDIPLRDLEFDAVSVSQPHVPPEPPTVETPDDLIDKIVKEVPNAERWIPAIAEQLKGNLNEFIGWFKKAKNVDLGGRPKGKTDDVKADVISVVSRVSSVKNESQILQPQQPSLLPDSVRHNKFWDDPQAWDVIRQEVPSNLLQEIKRDLEWFKREWKSPDSSYYGRQSKSHIKDKPLERRANADAIKYLVNMLNNTRKKRVEEYKDYLSESAIENIRRLLSDRYC